MHHFARLAALDHDACLAPQPPLQQAMVQGRRGQQAGNGDVSGGSVAVAEDQQRGAVVNGPLGRVDQFGQGFGKVPARVFLADGEQGRQHGHLEIIAFHGPQTLHVLIREDGMRQLELLAMLGRFVQQVPLLARKC